MTQDQFGSLTLNASPASYNLTFGCGISLNMTTGQVTIPEGLTIDDASRQFWDAVGRSFPLRRTEPRPWTPCTRCYGVGAIDGAQGAVMTCDLCAGTGATP